MKIKFSAEAGMSHTWYEQWDNNAQTIFVPGLSGIVSAQVRLWDMLGIKTGIGVSQLVICTQVPVMFTDGIGNIVAEPTAEIKHEYMMAEVPVELLLYFMPGSGIEVFAGISGSYNYMISATYNTKDISNNASYPILAESGEIYEKKDRFYPALSAQAGTNWPAGPGLVTASVMYTLYLVENELTGYMRSVKIRAGYLF